MGLEHGRDGYDGRPGRSFEEEVIPGGDDHKQAHQRVEGGPHLEQSGSRGAECKASARSP
jgi:hypothetical protein